MVTDTHSTSAPSGQADDEETETAPPMAADASRGSWNISLDTLQANLSHNTEEAITTFTACFRWCINPDHSMPLAEFARRVDVDETTVRRIMQGKYVRAGTKERLKISAELLKAMKDFLHLEGERASAKRIGFVETPTAQRIFRACELARESQSPVFIIGPSHVGKTWALTEYTDRNNHGRTIYCRMQAASGLGGMIKAIAAKIGVSDKSNTMALVERIKNALKPNMLLILDEVHQLMYTYRKESFFACLEVLREIYDHAGCGFVFCGTELLFKRIRDNRGELEQFFRRGVHKIRLPEQPLAADVKAVAAAAGLEFPERNMVCHITVGGSAESDRPYEMLRQIGREEGLKAITERIRYGRRIATKAHAELAWEHVVRAHYIIKKAAEPETDWS